MEPILISPSDTPIEKLDKWAVMGIAAPMYVSATLSGDETQKLQERLTVDLIEQKIPLEGYKIKRGVKDPAHITLAYHSDFAQLDDYADIIGAHYLHKKDQEIPIEVMGYGCDKYCVAALVKLGNDIKYYPSDKKLHLTMMLNGKPPVYSNELLKRLSEPHRILTEDERLVMFNQPIEYKCSIKFNQKIKSKKIDIKENNPRKPTQQQNKDQPTN